MLCNANIEIWLMIAVVCAARFWAVDGITTCDGTRWKTGQFWHRDRHRHERLPNRHRSAHVSYRGATMSSKLGGPVSWSMVLLPFYRKKITQVYPVWCSRLHNHTIHQKATRKLGVCLNFGVQTPQTPGGCAHCIVTVVTSFIIIQMMELDIKIKLLPRFGVLLPETHCILCVWLLRVFGREFDGDGEWVWYGSWHWQRKCRRQVDTSLHAWCCTSALQNYEMLCFVFTR